MTNREFFEAIINANINDEITAFATAGIEKLDHTNELRKVAADKKAAEKEAERAPLRAAIAAVLTSEPKTASTIIEEAGLEIKPQALTAILKPMVEAGEVIKTDVKVAGKGTAKGYYKA